MRGCCFAGVPAGPEAASCGWVLRLISYGQGLRLTVLRFRFRIVELQAVLVDDQPAAARGRHVVEVPVGQHPAFALLAVDIQHVARRAVRVPCTSTRTPVLRKMASTAAPLTSMISMDFVRLAAWLSPRACCAIASRSGMVLARNSACHCGLRTIVRNC